MVAYESFVDLAGTLSDDEWSTSMQCTPGWTVRDVLSHVAGVPDDALAGRMDGAPGEAWTAAQIERNRDLSISDLFERWAAQAADFSVAIEAMGETRPPFDCHSHEHDVCHAIGRPSQHDTLIVEIAGSRLAEGFTTPFVVTVELDDGRSISSGGEGDSSADGVVLRNVSTFDLFRSRLGRRTREQVRGFDWTGSDEDIDLVIDDWFRFGPSDIAIDE
jgi:uncharacterized protein (TIGR03083 family)